MITQEKIDRINALAKKSKTTGLTPQEVEEQQLLRKEYIEAYRASLRSALENTTVVRPDGTKEKLSEMKKKRN